jgi:hypothetical protein
MKTSFLAEVSADNSRSAMSMMVGLRPLLRADLARSPASFSEFPDSLAYTMVKGSAGRAGAAGCNAACAPPVEASRPAKNPASQARWTGVAVPTTRLRRSISSSAKGAVFGIGDISILTSRRRDRRRRIAGVRSTRGTGD